MIKGLITAAVLLINLVSKALLAAIQTYHAIKSAREAQYLRASSVSVLRDGQIMLIDSNEITLGDIVMLEVNLRVPADLRLIEIQG